MRHLLRHSFGSRSATPSLALLAEGHADSREMYAEFLAWCGYGVEVTGDGQDALAKAISMRPDVLITGTHLAKMDGYELCERLRTHPATATIPIIVLTSDAFPHQVQRAKLAADKVLVIPCPLDALQRAIKQFVQSSKRLRGGSSSPR